MNEQMAHLSTSELSVFDFEEAETDPQESLAVSQNRQKRLGRLFCLIALVVTVVGAAFAAPFIILSTQSHEESNSSSTQSTGARACSTVDRESVRWYLILVFPVLPGAPKFNTTAI
jgi:hypothetical protein